MNKNFKWYLIITFSVIALIIYSVYFFTDIGRRGFIGNDIETRSIVLRILHKHSY